MLALSGLRIGCVALTLFTCPDNTDAGSSFHTVFLSAAAFRSAFIFNFFTRSYESCTQA